MSITIHCYLLLFIIVYYYLLLFIFNFLLLTLFITWNQSTWNSNISLLNYLKYCTVCEGIQVDWCYARISAKTWVAPWQSQKRDGKIGSRKSLVERETKQKLAGRDEDNQRRNGKLQISWFSRACLNQNGYRHMHFIFIYKYINIFSFS